MSDLLVVDGVCRHGLEPTHLRVPAGSCIAVIGESGSGKTLLLRAIADLDVNQGEIWLDGEARSSMAAPNWRRRVGYVPAESGWWREIVADHFDDPSALIGLLHRLKMPAECVGWPVARLSTGERQRLALVRALDTAPRVLLLDEPTSGLDQETTLRVEAILHEKMAAGVAIVMVSHDRDQASRMAQSRYRMVDGRLTPEQQEGTAP